MSGLVRLDTMRTKAIKRADVAGASARHTTSECNGYVQAAWDELHEFVAGTSEDYFSTLLSFNTVSGVSTYPLPSDYDWLRNVQVLYNGWKTPLDRVEIADLGDWFNAAQVTQQPAGYVILGDNMQIVPTPTTVMTVEVLYVPLPTTLVNDSDTIACHSGWEEFIVWRAASTIQAIDGRDNTGAFGEAERQKKRILEAAHRRNLHQPRSVIRRYKRVRRQGWW